MQQNERHTTIRAFFFFPFSYVFTADFSPFYKCHQGKVALKNILTAHTSQTPFCSLALTIRPAWLTGIRPCLGSQAGGFISPLISLCYLLETFARKTHQNPHPRAVCHCSPIPTNQPRRARTYTHSAQRSSILLKINMSPNTPSYHHLSYETTPLSAWRIRKPSQHWCVLWPAATCQVSLHFHRGWLAPLRLRSHSRASRSSTFTSPSFSPTLPSNLSESIAFQQITHPRTARDR